MSSQVIADADAKMARAIEAMERDFQGIADRSRIDVARRAHPRRVLRHLDAAQPAGRHQRPRAAPDRHPAVGPRRPRRDREGDHQERHRPHAERRRHGRPAQHPAADRGASQGPRAGRPQADGRGRAWRSGTSVARPRPAQEGRARRRRRRRRGASRARRPAEDHRSPHRRGGPPRRGEGSRRSWRSSDSRIDRPTDATPASPRADARSGPGRRGDRHRPGRPAAPRRDHHGRQPALGARGAVSSEAEGHAAGVEAIRPIIRHAVRRGIPALSLFAFSSENWSRSPEEVDVLLGPARLGDPAGDPGTPRAGRPDPAARSARRAARATRGRRSPKRSPRRRRATG